MPFDAQAVKHLVTPPADWQAGIHAQWLHLQDLAVWGDLKSSQIGLLPKLRKRVLDLGEKLRSVCNDRGWIPHPREQIKNALGSSLNLLDSLSKLEESATALEGGADLDAFQNALRALRRDIDQTLIPRDSQLAALLDSQYQEEDAD